MQQGGVQQHSAIEDAVTMMKLYKFDQLAFETNAHLCKHPSPDINRLEGL